MGHENGFSGLARVIILTLQIEKRSLTELLQRYFLVPSHKITTVHCNALQSEQSRTKQEMVDRAGTWFAVEATLIHEVH